MGGHSEGAYGFDRVANKIQTTAGALINADTFAMFGVFARFADFLYRLGPTAQDRHDGVLVFDSNLPPPSNELSKIPVY